jgi:iron(III) transport system ATP-binding protein
MGSITAAHLRHVYPNGHVGLDDISFHAADGEFLALVGPSGSGKTTLLRSIAGFIRPARGTLSIGGRDVLGDTTWVPPEGRGLGMVFQEHAIWPHWSVSRNVGYALKLARVPRPEVRQRVDAVLEKVGLAGTGERNPLSMSGGQRQRVALARAIVATPQALLLDEALSSLDEPLRARLRLELRALTREEGLTTIHVTHDRSEALALADRIVVLRDGRVEQVGTPHQLLDEPDSAFVAGFVADATLFDATADNGAAVRVHGQGSHLRVDSYRDVGRGSTLQAAVMPADIVLTRVDHPVEGSGTVTSALFGLHGFDVSVLWDGVLLRAHVRDWQPRAGDVVVPTILKAHLFRTVALRV